MASLADLIEEYIESLIEEGKGMATKFRGRW